MSKRTRKIWFESVRQTKWTRATRQRLAIKQNGECAYCHGKTGDQTFDHVVPKSAGGLINEDNGVMACQECNVAKGNMSAAQFKKLIKTAKLSDGLGVLICHISRRMNLKAKRSVRNIYRLVGR